ncbi:MAG TPA: substrate-binding domain-containing protein [Candidatus Obscuribacterales bacterium]
MSQKNEFLPLIISIIITGSLLGAGAWWLSTIFFPHQESQSGKGDKNPPTEPPSPTQTTDGSFTQVPNVPNGVFRYGGSTTWAPIRASVDLDIQKTLGNFRLQYVHPLEGGIPSTGAGVEMLLNGKIDFALASRLLNTKDIEKAQQQGIKLNAIRVASSFKAIAVHRDLTLNDNGLTLHQIKQICDGNITNWQNVGGPDLPIQVFERNSPTSINTLGDRCQGSNVVYVSTPTEAIHKLAQTPGGFYVNTASLLVLQCSIKTLPVKNNSGKLVTPYKEPLVSPTNCRSQPNQVNVEVFKNEEYPRELSDTLYVVVKEDGLRGQQAGEAYVNLLRSQEGQKSLEEAGFVGIPQTTK